LGNFNISLFFQSCRLGAINIFHGKVWMSQGMGEQTFYADKNKTKSFKAKSE
jgi:hypothetical protein